MKNSFLSIQVRTDRNGGRNGKPATLCSCNGLVWCPHCFLYLYCVVGQVATGQSWHFASLTSPPIPATAQAPTVSGIVCCLPLFSFTLLLTLRVNKT